MDPIYLKHSLAEFRQVDANLSNNSDIAQKLLAQFLQNPNKKLTEEEKKFVSEAQKNYALIAEQSDFWQSIIPILPNTEGLETTELNFSVVFNAINEKIGTPAQNVDYKNRLVACYWITQHYSELCKLIKAKQGSEGFVILESKKYHVRDIDALLIAPMQFLPRQALFANDWCNKFEQNAEDDSKLTVESLGRKFRRASTLLNQTMKALEAAKKLKSGMCFTEMNMNTVSAALQISSMQPSNSSVTATSANAQQEQAIADFLKPDSDSNSVQEDLQARKKFTMDILELNKNLENLFPLNRFLAQTVQSLNSSLGSLKSALEPLKQNDFAVSGQNISGNELAYLNFLLSHVADFPTAEEASLDNFATILNYLATNIFILNYVHTLVTQQEINLKLPIKEEVKNALKEIVQFSQFMNNLQSQLGQLEELIKGELTGHVNSAVVALKKIKEDQGKTAKFSVTDKSNHSRPLSSSETTTTDSCLATKNAPPSIKGSAEEEEEQEVIDHSSSSENNSGEEEIKSPFTDDLANDTERQSSSNLVSSDETEEQPEANFSALNSSINLEAGLSLSDEEQASNDHNILEKNNKKTNQEELAKIAIGSLNHILTNTSRPVSGGFFAGSKIKIHGKSIRIPEREKEIRQVINQLERDETNIEVGTYYSYQRLVGTVLQIAIEAEFDKPLFGKRSPETSNFYSNMFTTLGVDVKKSLEEIKVFIESKDKIYWGTRFHQRPTTVKKILAIIDNPQMGDDEKLKWVINTAEVASFDNGDLINLRSENTEAFYASLPMLLVLEPLNKPKEEHHSEDESSFELM